MSEVYEAASEVCGRVLQVAQELEALTRVLDAIATRLANLEAIERIKFRMGRGDESEEMIVAVIGQWQRN